MVKTIIHRDLTATRYAIVKDSIVIGVTLLDIETNPNWKSPFGEAIQCDDTVARGDLFDGTVFTKPVPVETKPSPTLDTIISVLVNKGVVTQKDIDDATTAIAIVSKTTTIISD